MTRVALYARFSSDNQREASIEDQLRLCRIHAKRQGWKIARSYADRAVSGASLIRPGIQALLAGVHAELSGELMGILDLEGGRNEKRADGYRAITAVAADPRNHRYSHPCSGGVLNQQRGEVANHPTQGKRATNSCVNDGAADRSGCNLISHHIALRYCCSGVLFSWRATSTLAAMAKNPKPKSKLSSKTSKTALTEANLAALGAKRLAALLMEITGGNPALKRHVRLALASNASPQEAAREIRKRLGQIERARAFVYWRETRALAADLETQKKAILTVGEVDAGEALDLMWQFIAIATAVHDRCDDSSGAVSEVFRTACLALGPLAERSKPDPVALADRVYDALLDNGYNQNDCLVTVLADALGPSGLRHLKQRFEQLASAPLPQAPEGSRNVGWWGMDSAINYADEHEARSRQATIRMALQDIAEVEGDLDAFIAQYDPAIRHRPSIVADLAHRLLAANRVSEAIELVEHADYDESGWPNMEFEDTRIATYEAAGKPALAQSARWSLFERHLSTDHLRAFVAKLPDFEDQEALDRAFALASNHPNLALALDFFCQWPDCGHAARAVEARTAELDGSDYELMGAVADLLAARHPLAATLALRAMVDFSLANARVRRYRHAARHLMDCSGLAEVIDDYGIHDGHEAYVARLQREHGRKYAFWEAVGAA